MFTLYKDKEGDKNAEIEVFWGLGVTQHHRQHSHEVFSFRRFGDILGRNKKLNGSRDHNHPLLGVIFYLFG